VLVYNHAQHTDNAKSVILFKLRTNKGLVTIIASSYLENAVRQDDHNSKCYFRSAERVIHMNGSWFFVTREGEEGPYPSECEAQIEVARYISEQTELAHFQASREEGRAKESKLALVTAGVRPRIRPSEPLLRKRKVYI
jgi:hypothetical protein